MTFRGLDISSELSSKTISEGIPGHTGHIWQIEQMEMIYEVKSGKLYFQA